MTRVCGKKRAAFSRILCLAASGFIASTFIASTMMMSGCQRQQKGDTGKTYTSDSKPAKGGGAAGGAGGQSDAGPLNAPADTTNGQVSPASDAGSSTATHGQAVAEPGAPVEHAQQSPNPRKPQAPPGH